MTKDPMILGLLRRFRNNSGFFEEKDEAVFEKFINSLILKTNQSENCSITSNAFAQMCVGGDGDTGIDGIVIMVNDSIVCSVEDVDEIIKKQSRINIKFIFVQSKLQENLSCAEINSFGEGVVDFLSEKQHLNNNDQIAFWLEIKNYLMSDDIAARWDSYPKVSLYFAYAGTWIDDINLETAKTGIIDRANSTGHYSDISFEIIDSRKIIERSNEVENRLTVTLSFVECMGLNDAENVISSNLMLCKAKDFVSVLSDPDGNLRRIIFKDNVRDYQGETTINKDILQTIREKPAYFCLYNNGITIVCKKAMVINRKIVIENPQIVNGCQTCNVLFKAYKEDLDLSEVHLMVKVIATEDYNIANSVVKGTNMQNVVYDEAFEITREFHKLLERYFEDVQANVDESHKLHYERRSNQFAPIKSIPEQNIVSFGSLMQAFVSVFAKAPHDGFVHPATLLPKYKDQIFVDGQSFMPYFVAAKLFASFFGETTKKYRGFAAFKYQIMFVFAYMVNKAIPCDINRKNSIENYSKRILDALNDKSAFENYLEQAVSFFNLVKDNWVIIKNDPRARGIKTQAFTTYLIASLNEGKPLKEIHYEEPGEKLSYRGKVISVQKDRNGFYYGFIAKDDHDVFIHSIANPGFDFKHIVNREVIYELGEKDRKFGNYQGKIISLVQS